ncbi:hypothetical protein OROMI_017679 [Orobanche minor]
MAFSRDGKYSVKSAYKMAAIRTFEEGLTEEPFWRKLWKLKAPPKVKNCL